MNVEYRDSPAQSFKSTSNTDIEKGDLIVSQDDAFETDQRIAGHDHVRRNMKSRHLQMLALGGTLGTGIFLTTGSALSVSGPLGLALAFFIMGIVLYAVMSALGEMAALLPVSGSFVHYAARFVDPAMGFTVGWNYCYCYALSAAAEISAGALIISYWNESINPGAWITIFLVVSLFINLIGVHWFGELEFWFSLTKIITIIGLIILGIVITSGGYPSDAPQGKHAIGFRYWHNPGAILPFTFGSGSPGDPTYHVKGGSSGRFLSFWSTFETAAFSYLGTEIVALTAAEAANPSKTIPKAISRVFYRILLFYVASTFVLGLIISPENQSLISHAGSERGQGSPWVIAIKDCGIHALDHVVNAVILVAAFSASNSDVYASSRTLYGLALDNQAPRFFAYIDKRGIPIWSVVATWLIGFLSYMNCSSSGESAFTWFTSLTSISGLFSWVTILISYIRFYYGAKKQNVDRKFFPFRAPFQPWFSMVGLLFLVLVILFSAFQVFMKDSWATDTFVTNYLPVPVYIFLLLFWKFFRKTKFVRTTEMDFYHGRQSPEQQALDAAQDVPPKTWYGKFWNWLM